MGDKRRRKDRAATNGDKASAEANARKESEAVRASQFAKTIANDADGPTAHVRAGPYPHWGTCFGCGVHLDPPPDQESWQPIPVVVAAMLAFIGEHKAHVPPTGLVGYRMRNALLKASGWLMDRIQPEEGGYRIIPWSGPTASGEPITFKTVGELDDWLLKHFEDHNLELPLPTARPEIRDWSKSASAPRDQRQVATPSV